MFSIIEGSVPKSAVYKANLLSNDGPSLSYKDASGKPTELVLKYTLVSMSIKATRHEWKTVTLNLFDKTKIVADVDEETLRQISAVVEKKTEVKRHADFSLSVIIAIAIVGIVAITQMLYKPSQSSPRATIIPASQTPALTTEDGDMAIRNDIMNRVKIASDLLAGAEIDLKKGRMKSLDARTIGAVLEVINLTAREIKAAWYSKDKLEPADVKYVRSIESRLVTFQQRALPQMRLAYKNAAGEVLWEHDVTVELSGSGNTVLSFYGYWFAMNANIKASVEPIYELTTQLRFRTLQFASFRSAPTGSAYKLEAPNDSVVATFDNGSFTKIKHSPRKQQ